MRERIRTMHGQAIKFAFRDGEHFAHVQELRDRKANGLVHRLESLNRNLVAAPAAGSYVS